MIRWETTTRYYLASVQPDLFGEWELFRAWGAKGSGLGNQMRQSARDREHARELLCVVARERQARGYRLVSAEPAFGVNLEGAST